jgi:hypothetical protein
MLRLVTIAAILDDIPSTPSGIRQRRGPSSGDLGDDHRDTFDTPARSTTSTGDPYHRRNSGVGTLGIYTPIFRSTNLGALRISETNGWNSPAAK